jgi:acetyltransferase-like isoleucine patch superfamily enzyme
MQHVTLGRHSVVDVHGSIGHDTRVGDFLTLHPGGRLSGGVDLDSGVELGTGAIGLPGRRVGRNSIVGAGAVVTRDLPADCTAVGVPARPFGYRSSP